MKKRFMILAIMALSPSLIAMEEAVKEVEEAVALEKLLPEDIKAFKTFNERIKQVREFLKQTESQLPTLIKEGEELTAEEQNEQEKVALLAENIRTVIQNINSLTTKIKVAIMTLKPQGWGEWIKKALSKSSTGVEASAKEEIVSNAVSQLGILKLYINEFNEKLAEFNEKDTAKIAEQLKVINETLASTVTVIENTLDTIDPQATLGSMVNNLFNSLSSYAHNIGNLISNEE